jgi:four helix bundle protein
LQIKSFKDLEVWRKGIEIVDLVYDITLGFPQREQYALSSQMQRSAVSIPSNIAEGFCRQHTREYLQFCHIALGSCAELDTQLVIARRRKYLSQERFFNIEEGIDHESRMLMRLIKRLKNK